MSLAVAISPVTHAAEAPAKKGPQPAQVTVEVKKAAEATAPVDAFAGLQKQFETMNKAINDARNEAKNVASQRDSARKEAHAMRETAKKLEAELAQLKKQLEGSNHQAAEWKQKSDQLEKKLGAGAEAYEKLASFRDEMGSALKEFAVLKKDLADVRGELQAPAERVALKKELASLKQSGDEVAKKLKSEIEAHAESKRLLAMSKAAGEQVKKAFVSLKKEAKSQFAALTKMKEERDALDKKLGSTNKALADVRKESEQRLTAKNNAEKELNKARTELTATRDSLAMLQKEASQLRGTVEPLAAEIKAANQQSELAIRAIKEAISARETAEKNTLRLEGELKQTNDRLAAALKDQNGLKQQVASKSTEVKSLRKKIEDLEAKTAAKEPSEEEALRNAGL